MIGYLCRHTQNSLLWIKMSAPTVRKLGRISDGAKTSYFLLPPRNWLDMIEKNAGKKILQFAIKAEAYSLVLKPMFEQSEGEQPRNSTPEDVMLMLEQGTLMGKLREIKKGKTVYRTVNIPRMWVREREAGTNRKVSALSVIAQPTSLIIEPIFGEKIDSGRRT